VQDAHAGHLSLAAQTGEFSPTTLRRQQLDQQIYRMHRGEQTQQMNPVKLCRAVITPPSASGSVRPALIDKIIGHERV